MEKKYFVLKNNEPVEEPDYFKWAVNPNNDVTIAQDDIEDLIIKTKFYGVALQPGWKPDSKLFSTSVNDDRDTVYYTTYQEAESGHKEICKTILRELHKEEPTGGIS